MEGKQSAVAVTGIGLVAVNYWTSDQRTALVGTLWDKKDPKAAHKALLGIGGELLLVGVLTFAAGQSDTLGTGMLAVLAALWILWAITYYTTPHRSSLSPSSPNSATPAPGSGGSGPNPNAGGGGGGGSW